MFKKNIVWGAIFVSAVALAAVYYTTVSSSLTDVASVNNEIKMNLNSKVAAWQPGDTVIVNSLVESGQASYSYAPLNGVFTLTSVVRDGEGGGSTGSGGGGTGDGGYDGGSGSNLYDDSSCDYFEVCTNIGAGG